MRTFSRRRGWILAAVAAGLVALPATPAGAQVDLDDLTGQGDRDGSSEKSGDPTAETPGLTGSGDPLDREEMPGRVVQDPGGTVAELFPNGVPGMPKLTPDTKPSPISEQKARTLLFGRGYDTPGEVRGRVVGNTTWLVSYGGTVALHDSTIEDNFADTGRNANTNGFVKLADVLAAKPDVIFLDHSHFDHTHNLAEIATRTGAPLVTSLGSCGWVKYQALKQGFSPSKVKCNLLREPDGTPMNDADSYFTMPYGGEGVLFSAFGAKGKPERPLPGGLKDTAVLIKHTATFNRPPTYPDQISGANINPQESLDRISKNPPTPDMLWRTYAPFDLEGGNYLHKVTYQGFDLVHHGSTGATYGLDPGAKDILRSLKSLGDKDQVDVEIGGIVEASWLNTDYFKDAKEYSKAINAKVYFPVHHFDWYSYWLTSPAVSYWPGMKQTWADGAKEAKGAFPDLCFATEKNYGTVWKFKIDEWKGAGQGKIKPMTGPGCYTG